MKETSRLTQYIYRSRSSQSPPPIHAHMYAGCPTLLPHSQLMDGLNDTADNLLAAIERDEAEISPSTLYAVAAAHEGVPFVNGSPQVGVRRGQGLGQGQRWQAKRGRRCQAGREPFGWSGRGLTVQCSAAPHLEQHDDNVGSCPLSRGSLCQWVLSSSIL